MYKIVNLKTILYSFFYKNYIICTHYKRQLTQSEKSYKYIETKNGKSVYSNTYSCLEYDITFTIRFF